MDTKNVIANMDNNRLVLGAQVRRLSELAPRGPSLPSATDVAGGAAELLAGTISADLAAAAYALQAVAEAETEARSTLRNSKRQDPTIIDVTPTEVK